MKKIWTARELASACSGKLIKETNKQLSGFAIDNRKVESGNVFVAIKGETHDGHKFCEAAIKAGASAIIVSSLHENILNENVSVIQVDDTLKALQKTANYYRHSLTDTKFLAVTGSNGKTTTRSMVFHILSKKYKCHMTEGNFNNHIGLPLTILSIDSDCEYAILEMGMNHKGEITELCKIAEPDAAVINSVGPAHIGNLGSLENIAKAKAEILESLNSKNKIGIYPADTQFSEIFKQAGKNCSLYSFGRTDGSDYKIGRLKSVHENYMVFDFAHDNKEVECVLHLAGEHNIDNAAAAMSLCSALHGVDHVESARMLSEYTPVGARMETIKRDGITILFDCYNANPASMASAVKYLSKCESPRIAVLGDMRELGELSEKYHRELGEQVAKCGIELLLCVGEETKYTVEEAKKFGMNNQNAIKLNSNDETAEFLKESLKKNSTVLFKASRGIYLEKVVQRLWPDLGQGLH